GPFAPISGRERAWALSVRRLFWLKHAATGRPPDVSDPASIKTAETGNRPRRRQARKRREPGNKPGRKTMFAVIKTGGKQYKVAANDLVRVEKLAGDSGDAVTFENVLMVG